MDIGTLVTNPFLLDLSVNSGIVVLLLLVGLALFMFFRKSFFVTGILSWFIGVLLLYNGITWLIASIPLLLGTVIIFGGGRR